MLSSRKSLYVLAPTLLVLWAGSFRVARSQAQRAGTKNAKATSSGQGQHIFATKCASCHGLDGRGGERGANIAGNAMLRRLPDSDLVAIVLNGVRDAGMPAFPSLGPAGARAVVGYLRVLQGANKGPAPPGDPASGKRIFFGKGDCSSCHMVRGEGGFVGPDLSAYAVTRPVAEILAAITQPGKNGDAGYKAAAAVTSDGRRVSGIVRNEDNFSVQMQTSDGAFHFFLRSDLQALEYQDHPLMPTDYAERLSHEELNDLASYLMRVATGDKPAGAPKEKVED